MAHEIKDKTLGIRLSEPMLSQLEELAEADLRKASAYARIVLEQHIKKVTTK